jgi:hypothetical protein
MTQVDQSKNDMMSAQEMSIFPVKPDEQGSEFVDPSQAVFTGKAPFVNRCVEQTFAPAFRGFAVALVLGNIGDHPILETGLARLTGIEGAVGVEKTRPRWSTPTIS